MKSNKRKKAKKNQVSCIVSQGNSERYNSLLAIYHQGKVEEARSGLESYILDYPNDPDGWNLLGLVHRKRLAYDEAVSCLEKALSLNERNVLYWNNLGSIYKDRGDYDRALEVFQQALSRNPNHADILYNVGLLHHSRGEYDLARDWYRKSLAIRPDFAMAQGNLVSLDKEQGRIEEALRGYRSIIDTNPMDHHQWSNYLLVSNYLETLTPEDLFSRHVEFGTTYEKAFSPLAPADSQEPILRRRIRIGFVSADFRTHSVAFFLMPFLVGYDRKRFEVFCYSNGKTVDETTQKMQALVDHWRNIMPLSDEDAARTIQADRIDILVDLAGHSGYNRLPVFALKPAPVQVTWLGYPNTTGLTRIDYRLTDAWVDPPGDPDRLHTERLVRLPDGFLCYQAPSDCPEVSDLPAAQTGRITFGSFNNHVKITSYTIRLWSRILHAVHNSRLVLKSSVKQDTSRMDAIMKDFLAQGIEPERITFLEYLPLKEHFAAYHGIDIALDTFPYNGTTTTCEALYMGVPVAALSGNSHAGRVSAGILTQIGLVDWVATDEEALVKLVVEKASHIEGLQNLRMQLRQKMQTSTLMDRQRFVRNLQQAFEEMWERWCRKQLETVKKSIVWIGADQAEDRDFLAKWVRRILTQANRGTEIGCIEDRDAFLEVFQRAKQDKDPSNRPYWMYGAMALSELDTCLAEGTAIGIYVYSDNPYPKIGSEASYADPRFPTESNGMGKPFSMVARSLLSTETRKIPSTGLMVISKKDLLEDPLRWMYAMASRLSISLEETAMKRIADECRTAIVEADTVLTKISEEKKGLGPMNLKQSDQDLRFSHLDGGAPQVDIEDSSLNRIDMGNRMHDLGHVQTIGMAQQEEDVLCVSLEGGLTMILPKTDGYPTSGWMLLERKLRKEEREFLKKWMTSGMYGVDIGAGYGPAALFAASLFGLEGGIWTFEKDPARLACLFRSSAVNRLYTLHLVKARVSDRTEERRRSFDGWAETQTLALDDARLRYDMPQIDWVRIDAAEDTLRAFEGGRRFFTENSPLIQVVFGTGGDLIAEVIQWAEENGYDTYRLIPMLACLVPCRNLSEIEVTQPSLYFCKPDRAAKLSTMGALVRQEIDIRAGGASDPTLWLEHVRSFPYAIRLLKNWESYIMEHLRNPAWRVHQEAMSSYAIANMTSLSLDERWRTLMRAQLLLTDLVAKEASFSRLQTMARISMDMGLYSRASAILNYLVQMMEGSSELSIDEPFLCPSKRLESVDPNMEIGSWCLASIVETLENANTLTDETDDTQSLGRIDILKSTPFFDDRLEERRVWIERKQCMKWIDESLNLGGLNG
uniref:protein O-GlcNAc transferase n=1 Tax=Desulfatirhabdium butyrativorans TaxID=340467 RepID=A0A7C4RU32_9BACT